MQKLLEQKLKLAREIAKRTRPEFVEIPRERRSAYKAMEILHGRFYGGITELLVAEQQRLAKEWEE